MRICGTAYKAIQLEKAVEVLAMQCGLYVEIVAQKSFHGLPILYRCTIRESKVRHGFAYVGVGNSMFAAVENAYAYYLGQSE